MKSSVRLIGGGVAVFAIGFAAGDLARVGLADGAREAMAMVFGTGGVRFPRGDTLVLADTIQGRCGGFAPVEKTACYEKQLMALRGRRGTRFAMGALNRLSNLDHDVMSDGHEYTHAIGITAFKETKDVGGAFKSCTEILQSGCYHGVIQTYLLSVPHVGEPEVRAVCKEYTTSAASQWLRFQCVHGMGHGLTMFYDHDLPHALQSCDLLAERWDQQSCYGGAFMENIVYAEDPRMGNMVMGDAHAVPSAAPMAMDGHEHAPSKYAAIDSSDLYYPCSKLAARYQQDCWAMQPAVMLYLLGNDFRKVFKACDAAPVKWRFECYAGTGTEVSGQTVRDHARSIQLCSGSNPKYQPWCFQGVVKNYIDVTADHRDGLAFCREIPGRANQLRCYESVGEEIAVLRSPLDARAALCRDIVGDEGARDACLFGAQVLDKPPPGTPIAE